MKSNGFLGAVDENSILLYLYLNMCLVVVAADAYAS
jgi:hypothetical protein